MVALLLSASPAPADIGLLIPAYFYPVPGSPWSLLDAAAPRVPLTAIANPASGPGTSVDPSYTAVINSLRASGGKVVGYVYSSYAARPLGLVLAEIDTWDLFYPLNGIFVDEMSNAGDAATLDYYAAIYAHVKGINANWMVIGNPGTQTLESYLTRPAADVLIVVENTPAIYDHYVPSPWNATVPADRLCHLVHTQLSAAQMKAELALARTRNAGWVYLTDDVMINPWDTLATYWNLEVCLVELANGGDLDADGDIDLSDLSRLLANFGTTVNPPDGDVDGDGDVDLSDLSRLLARFGSAC